jgi:hypothetical protein
MNNLRSTILVGVALATAAFMLLPSVAAQGTAPTMNINKVGVPTTPIKPQIENPSFTLEYVYTLPTPALSPVGTAQSGVNIQFSFTCQNGVTITGPASKLQAITAGQNAANVGTASFQVSIPRTAPGLQAIPCLAKARGDQVNQGLPASNEAQFPFTVTADYYSVNQVKLASKLKQSGPQKQVPFEMEITNFGNARTQYTFEIGAEPGGKWQEILPEVLLLDSPNSGQGSPTNTAIFTVATPFKNGWNNEEGSYQIVVKPSAADDPSKSGNPLTANMLVRVRGVYVPGLEPFVLVGAVLGSALLMRLTKDEE